MSTWCLCLTLLFLPLLLAVCPLPGSNSPTSALPRAEHLVRTSILIDGHVDLPDRLRHFSEDPTAATVGGDFDYPRAQRGGLDAPFMSIYIPTNLQTTSGAAKQRADRLIDRVERLVDESPKAFSVATSVRDVRKIARTDRVALPMGIENGAALEGELDHVAHFYERGVRYITLTHGKHNAIGDSSYDDAPPLWHGLSSFGEEVIEEMNRLGIMVDISHVTDATAFDAVAVSRTPVIASHSSCRHFTPGWERNLSDELIRAIADTDGVVMITFGSSFLRSEYQDRDDPIRGDVEDHIESMGWCPDSRQAVVYKQQVRKSNPIGTISDVADHIDHVVELVGIEHVGVGSDFDGVFALPKGLQDASDYPNLVAELLRRGYEDKSIRKILGENVLRVWKEVEAAATSATPAS